MIYSSYAQANAARAVPVLKEAKQKQTSFAQARVDPCGCFEGHGLNTTPGAPASVDHFL